MLEIKNRKEFEEYVDMLVDLNLMNNDGRNGSEEAEVLCDKMDAPYDKLNSVEVRLVKRIATDLNSRNDDINLEWSVRKKLAMEFLKERYEELK